MSDRKSIDLGLTSALDELFMDDQGRKENALPKIYDIPLSEIDDFPDHPFHVRNDEDMDQLVESIKERGIITPVMLRQKELGCLGKPRGSDLSAKGWSGQGLEPKGAAFLRPPDRKSVV